MAKYLSLKDLNLDIEEGEFVTMLGPSGSGKTTCLMMLAGFETPTHGEIYLDGKSYFKYSTSQKRNWNGISKLRFISTYDSL